MDARDKDLRVTVMEIDLMTQEVPVGEHVILAAVSVNGGEWKMKECKCYED